jgi:hypothetical protein
MNTSQSRYIRSRGKILGPFSVEQLQLLRARGQLHRFHEVSEDRLTWVTAASLTELFPPEAPPPAAAAPSYSRPADVSLAAMSPPGLVGYQTNASASESVRDGWSHVRTGLGLLLLSNFIWLGGVAVVLLGFLLLFAEGDATSARASSVREEVGVLVSMGARSLLVLVLWVLIHVAATILQLVGHGFCLMVAPRSDSGVQALAIAVFVLAVTAVVLSVLTRMASFSGRCARRGRFLPCLRVPTGCRRFLPLHDFLAEHRPCRRTKSSCQESDGLVGVLGWLPRCRSGSILSPAAGRPRPTRRD